MVISESYHSTGWLRIAGISTADPAVARGLLKLVRASRLRGDDILYRFGDLTTLLHSHRVLTRYHDREPKSVND